MRKVTEGERPERPEGARFTDDLWRTLEQCWLSRPRDRPTVKAVLECLGHVSMRRRPLLPIVEDLETDELVSATSQRTFLHFAPNSLPTI